MRKFEKKMSKKLQKSVSNVICRVKTQTSNLQISRTTKRILNGCRQPPKTVPLYANSHRLRRRKSSKSDLSEPIDKSAATLEDIDRFLFENFRSLYLEKYDSDLEEEDDFETPDLTPGGSGYISSTITSRSGVESASLKPDLANRSVLREEEQIAVMKATADPVEEFRRSMGEVMAARERRGEEVGWGFMEEMLFSYLRMNEKKHYRFVLDAFVDSVVDMRRNSCDGGGSGGAVTEVDVGRKETDTDDRI